MAPSPWVFSFLAFFSLVFASQTTTAINQTELQSALVDMRASSYNGFVILLQMLNSDPTTLKDEGEITFLMPDDIELSNSVLSIDRLREFLLSHSFPTTLPLINLIHLPTGTIIPSSFPNKTITIGNHGRVNYFVNNAKILKPNLCSSAFIKCHGLTNIMRFDNVQLSSRHEMPPTTQVMRDAFGVPTQSNSSMALLGAAPPLQ